jgi:hypothetical protein
MVVNGILVERDSDINEFTDIIQFTAPILLNLLNLLNQS